ncbi:MAG: hypothetical protein U9Q83_06125 [Bacteroidota bacterium]|nr:hypothetical protein [Bacteroidota bacterium]
MDRVEFHTKEYGLTKSKDPSKDKKNIGLETRIIIIPILGASKVLNFDYQVEASKYLKDTYGDIKDKKYEMVNLFKKYGKRGYRW